MEKVKLLLIFAEVLQQGSMSRAASSLGMSASAVSQHIRRLESLYGLKLLNRTTRRLEPTEAGQTLLRHARQLAQQMEQADEAMAELKHSPAGTVRISLPTGFVSTQPIRRTLEHVRLHYPDIKLTLFAEDHLTDLQNNAADIAIRTVDDGAPDNIVKPLGFCRLHLCASPAYLAEHPVARVKDLPHAHWLYHREKILLEILASLKLPAYLPKERTECPSSASAAHYLATEGLGLTYALSLEIAPLLSSGRLQLVLPQYRLPGRTLYAVIANAAQPGKNRAVLNVLQQAFAPFRTKAA